MLCYQNFLTVLNRPSKLFLLIRGAEMLVVSKNGMAS